MRPVYESEFDRSNEGYIKKYIESKGKFTYEKSEPFSSIDGLLFQDGKHVGNVEIKTRTNASDKYLTYKEDKVIPLLIVRFTDGVFTVVLEDRYEKRLGGRHDRNDSHDTETCMYIPMTEFVQI